MDEHLDLQAEIPAYVDGRLDDAERSRFELHLATCVECQNLVICCEEVSALVTENREPAHESHPQPLRLRDYARGRNGTGTDEMERHLDRCAACALEVSAWRRQSRGSFVAPVPVEPQARLPWPTLAAGILLGAVLSLGGLALLGIPGTDRTTGGWSGTAQLLLLDEPTRSGTTVPVVRVARAQPFVPVAVRFEVPPHLGGTDRIHFAVDDFSGRPVWEAALDGRDVREQLGTDGVVGLLVPSDSLVAGRHALSVASDDGGATVFVEIPFDVRR